MRSLLKNMPASHLFRFIPMILPTYLDRLLIIDRITSTDFTQLLNNHDFMHYR